MDDIIGFIVDDIMLLYLDTDRDLVHKVSKKCSVAMPTNSTHECKVSTLVVLWLMRKCTQSDEKQ